MLNIEKPFVDGVIRLVRVQVNGQPTIVTGRVNMSQKALIISKASYDRLEKKFGRGEIRALDSRCDSDWRVWICVE